MVLSIYQYHCCFSAEELEGSEHLDAFANRYIGVCCTVEEKKWRVNLVGIEKRTLVHIEMLVSPRIGICHRHFAVAVAPVTLAPVAGVVADTCMRNGCCEDVSHRL